jgi:hypothetical protein
MLEFRLNLIYGPQDFYLGNFMKNSPVIDSSGLRIPLQIENFEKYLIQKTESVNDTLTQLTGKTSLNQMISECVSEVENALKVSKNPGWITMFPGKRLLEEYAKQEQLWKPPAFVNLLIKELSSKPANISPELKAMVECIATGKDFPGSWFS